MAHVLAKDLREAVLQAAITGGLSSKKQEDTKVDDLLKEIEIEKKHLMEKGLLPKEKKLKPINDDDIVLEIPKHWKMVRTQDISTYITDYVANGSFATLKQNTTTYQYEEYAIFVRTVDLTSNFKGKLSYIDEKSYNWLSKSKLYGGELILPNIGGSIGKTFIMPKLNKPMSLAPNSIMLKFHYDVLNVFFSYIIQSPYGQNLLISTKGGTATPKFSKTDLRNMVIPITSIEEIIRIVAKVDEIMAKIDEYEKLENQLVKLKEQFPQDMKDSLLRSAFEGRMTTQNKEESVDTCIKSLIKNSKKFSLISQDEFNIPHNWTCFKFSDIFDIRNGFTPLRSNPDFWNNKDVPWFTIEDIRSQGRFITRTEQYISKKALSNNTKRILPKDTVLLCCTASVGEFAYSRIELTTNQQFNGLVVRDYVKSYINPLYVYYFVQTLKDKLIDNSGKTTFNFLSVTKLGKILIPIPPIEEQQRIVDKLDEVLPLVDKLTELN